MIDLDQFMSAGREVLYKGDERLVVHLFVNRKTRDLDKAQRYAATRMLNDQIKLLRDADPTLNKARVFHEQDDELSWIVWFVVGPRDRTLDHV